MCAMDCSVLVGYFFNFMYMLLCIHIRQNQVGLVLGVEGGEVCVGPQFLGDFVPQSWTSHQENSVSCTDEPYPYVKSSVVLE